MTAPTPRAADASATDPDASRPTGRFASLPAPQRTAFTVFAVGTALALGLVVATRTGTLAAVAAGWDVWALQTALTLAATCAVALFFAATRESTGLIVLVGVVGYVASRGLVDEPSGEALVAGIVAGVVFIAAIGLIATDETSFVGGCVATVVRWFGGLLVALRLVGVPIKPRTIAKWAPATYRQGRAAGTRSMQEVLDDQRRQPAGLAPRASNVGVGERRADDGSSADANAEPNAVDAAKLVVDLSARARDGKVAPVVGRDAEIQAVEEIIGQLSPANAALLGSAGVGKTAIVEGLAVRWTVERPEQRLLSVDAGAVKAAGNGLVGGVERAWQAILVELRKPDTVGFVDEVHTAFADADVANLLKPALGRGEIRLVAASTHKEWQRDVAPDAALTRRFTVVKVAAPSLEDAIAIVRSRTDAIAAHNEVTISDEAVETATRLAERYVTEHELPASAVALVSRAASRAEQRHVDAVSPELVVEVLAAQLGVPVGSLGGSDHERLRRLDEHLRTQVVGQDEAIAHVVDAVQARELGITDADLPLSLILLGPTGVGKTETALTLARWRAPGNKDALVRIDCGKYQDRHQVAELVGAPPGYIGHEDGGVLTNAVRRGARVVLLDEIEKMHADGQKLLLSVLDTGELTDNRGERVSFRNVDVILTSNLGARGGASTQAEMEAAAKRHFLPEVWGRIAHKLYFRALSPQAAHDIAGKALARLAERVKGQRGIELAVSDELRAAIVEQGYDVDSGARSLRPVIALSVESALKDAMLAGTIPTGARVRAMLAGEPGNHGQTQTDDDGTVLLGVHVQGV